MIFPMFYTIAAVEEKHHVNKHVNKTSGKTCGNSQLSAFSSAVSINCVPALIISNHKLTQRNSDIITYHVANHKGSAKKPQ